MSTIYIILVWVWVWWCRSALGEVCQQCHLNPCRRVTGLFTRPTLPTGYNLIARVPARACNLTVTELGASTNYLAVRTGGGYIINGNWALLPQGKYMGAGTGFLYTRSHPDGGEVITAQGPLTIPIDIMMIYQSTNPGVRYEYWHPLGPSYRPASQAGGRRPRGRHHHHHRQRGPSALHSALPAYLASPRDPLIGDRSPNNLNLVGGVSGSVVGPDIQTSSPEWKVWKFTPCSRTCGGGQQQTVYICTRDGGTIMADELCQAPKPAPQTVRCNPRPCPPTWQLGEWSPCSTTCGPGLRTRTWACVQEVTPTLTRAVPPSTCPQPLSSTLLPLTQPCSLLPCTRWEVTTWNKCSVDCGTGVKTRLVTCRVEGRRVTDDKCNAQERPPHQDLCHAHTCATHTWFYTDWSQECVGGCEDGVQQRRVWCSPGVNAVEGECNQNQRPAETRPCPLPDACAAAWFTGPWSACSVECGNGTRTREVVCVVFLRGSFRATLDIECNADTKPEAAQPCNPDACPPHWYYTDWSQCSRTCGRGSKNRAVQCLDHHQQPSNRCPIAHKPLTTRPCVNQPCHKPADRNCVDRFRNCLLVQQARLCRYSYYRTVCCASCFNQQ